MTELERTLKEILGKMEQEITETLKAHSQAIHQLQANLNQMQTDYQESTQHLQRLSDIHANLEPLLSRLSNALGDK